MLCPGVQQLLVANFFVGRGVVEIGAWGRFCGPGDALWLTIQRRGTFLGRRALGKVLGPWQSLAGAKKAGWIGPGDAPGVDSLNTTAILFGCGSRIKISFAADALKTAL